MMGVNRFLHIKSCSPAAKTAMPQIWQAPADHRIPIDHHLSVEVIWMQLADELPAAAAGRQNLAVPVDSDHLQNQILSSSNHSSGRGVLSTESHGGGRIYTDTGIHFAIGC